MTKCCDGCGKEVPTQEFWFEDSGEKWSRFWCQKCLAEWKRDQKELIALLEKTLEAAENPSFWQRFKRFTTGRNL